MTSHCIVSRVCFAVCCDRFWRLFCRSFSRSIEVYVPPDLLQIGVIITHKKSITTLVWHHGFGELITGANTAGTLRASTLCCPAFRRLRHLSSTLGIHVSPFAPVRLYGITSLHGWIAPSCSKSVRSNAHKDFSSFFHPLPVWSDLPFGCSERTWSNLAMELNVLT